MSTSIISDHQIQFKRSHQYYTQDQAQLAITGLEWCDLYVWCEGCDPREVIWLDQDFWQIANDKLDILFEFVLGNGTLNCEDEEEIAVN